MGFVYDRSTDRSDLVLLDGQTMETIATVHLPARVPHGFHGNWVPTEGWAHSGARGHRRMSVDAPRGAEWHWLWMVYVVGVCGAAMFAVVVLDHRFPGNIPVAIAAIAGMMLCVVTLGRRVFVLPENSWGAVLFVGSVVALWTLALWASPVAVAAVPTIYPLVFATLTLRAALVITTAINLIPADTGDSQGRDSVAESQYRHCLYAHWGDHRAGDRHRDHHVDAAT